ncbi:hypothetical protein [Mesorhizobium sp. WSM3862]|uniref:hypothetical protein n=2 Tax=unclassified Mesorhizobium TaxID=325217 RepID=UPI001140B92B|nr:hypothetical protein [Mesorhizobium sp. WSM3862]
MPMISFGQSSKKQETDHRNRPVAARGPLSERDAGFFVREDFFSAGASYPVIRRARPNSFRCSQEKDGAMIYDVKISARTKEDLRVAVERYYIIEVNGSKEVNAKAISRALQDGDIDLVKVIRKTRMAF